LDREVGEPKGKNTFFPSFLPRRIFRIKDSSQLDSRGLFEVSLEAEAAIKFPFVRQFSDKTTIKTGAKRNFLYNK
jgi:hypothetical protein